MDLVNKYLREMTDPRGKVKAGKVTLDANNDFQRQILNQSYQETKGIAAGNMVSRAMGAKTDNTAASIKQIEKIYRESKQYWNDGGKYINVEGKKVKLELHFDNRDPGKKYYASYSWGGWVGSTDLYKYPHQAMKQIEKDLMEKVKKDGSLKEY